MERGICGGSNMMLENTAKYINVLGGFCGKRDIVELTSEQLYKKFEIEQADVMVLFGGSVMWGGDVLAQAMKNWDISIFKTRLKY